MEYVRIHRLRPAYKKQHFATWNIEGLTEAKIASLQVVMRNSSIGVMCIQETHKPMSDYYSTDDDFLIILSGSTDVSKEHAGVGFIVAPWMRSAIVGVVCVVFVLCMLCLCLLCVCCACDVCCVGSV